MRSEKSKDCIRLDGHINLCAVAWKPDEISIDELGVADQLPAHINLNTQASKMHHEG